MTLLLLYVSFALGISFLCSLLEAALLSSRASTLTERTAAGSRGAGRLLRLKQTRIDDAISAILILNTLANTLGATMAGAQASRIFGTWVGVFSGVLTFLILVVSEIIPKTLGASYAAGLSAFTGNTLHFMTLVMSPALLLSRTLTRLLTRSKKTSLSRGELEAIIVSASAQGTLSEEESEMFGNLLRFNEVRVEDVMTPRTVTFMMPADATVGDMLASEVAPAFSRIPLFRRSRDNVVGYVLQREVLKDAAEGCDRSRRLETFLRPTWFVPEIVSVGEALRQFLERRETMAMVADEHGGVAGLVTVEDLTETILGAEIVDESDAVVDLRQAAAVIRDRRLERLRHQRDPSPGPLPGEGGDPTGT